MYHLTSDWEIGSLGYPSNWKALIFSSFLQKPCPAGGVAIVSYSRMESLAADATDGVGCVRSSGAFGGVLKFGGLDLPSFSL